MKITAKIEYSVIKMYYAVEGLLALYLGNERGVQRGSEDYLVPNVIVSLKEETHALATLEFINFEELVSCGKMKPNAGEKCKGAMYLNLNKQLSSILDSAIDAHKILGTEILMEVPKQESLKDPEKYAIDKYFYYDESTDTLYLLKKIPEDCEGIKIPTEDKKAGMILLLENKELMGMTLYGCQQFFNKKSGRLGLNILHPLNELS